MKLLYFIVISTLLNLNILAQNQIVVSYKYHRVNDTTSFNKIKDKRKKEKLRRQSQKIYKYAEEYDYILKIKGEESYYYLDERMGIDEVEDEFTVKMSKLVALGSGTFYQNKKNKQVTNYKVTLGKHYAIRDTLYKDWKITNETKYIGNFKVYKAYLYCQKCNRNITAWFAPELPLPFGPAGYGGLPGLILEVKQYKNILRMETLKFPKKPIKFNIPTATIPITKAKLEELQWNKRMELMQKRRH